MMAWAELAAFLIVLTALTPVLGQYMTLVFADRAPSSAPPAHVGERIERLVFTFCHIDPRHEMSPVAYLTAVLTLSIVSAGALFALLCTQAWLPLNPQHFGDLDPLLAFNVAVSFMTTTDWQAYAGETTLSHLAQMAGLGWQNFLAAGVGLAVAIAFIRGFTRSTVATIGNFWVDLTRSILYVLLPVSMLGALLLIAQGTPQNFAPDRTVTTLDGGKETITGGPIASQEIIKQLGANGGGFVAANSAAPNENPTPLTDFVGIIAMLGLGAALTNTFGRLVGDQRQGWLLYAVMMVCFVAGFIGVWGPEHAGNPFVHALGISGPNLEGKELRFGDTGAAISVAAATDTSSGAANLAYDSLMPLSVLVALLDMQVGEVIFGGVGSGLYGMLILVLLTVFIAGLMVGRTPEYLGKKLEQREMTFVMTATLIPALLMLVPTAVALLPGISQSINGGPRSFSEVLYAFTSVGANNGSALGGLTTTTALYDWLTAAVMLGGRFSTLAIVLLLAGVLSRKPRNVAVTAGTFRTTSPMFGILLLATIVVVTALTFVPADALGPIAEHLMLRGRQTF